MGSHRKKGQLISGDFIVGITIFLLIVSIIALVYSKMSSDIQEREMLEDIHTTSTFVTEAMVKTEGIPHNWNNTNVISIGLAAGERVNKTKIRYLMMMSQDDIKRLLSLTNFEFNLSFWNTAGYYMMSGAASSPAAYFPAGDNGMLSAIQGSGLVWDAYYTGSSPSSDQRFSYVGADKKTVFNMLMNNASYYRTIIIEDYGISAGENTTALINFVRSGGILILEGDSQFITPGFNMTFDPSSGNNWVVRANDLMYAPDGAVINFPSAAGRFYSSAGNAQLNVIIEDPDEQGKAAAGYWDLGVGRVYYVTDMSGSYGSVPLSNILYFIGKKAEITHRSHE